MGFLAGELAGNAVDGVIPVDLPPLEPVVADIWAGDAADEAVAKITD